MQILRWGLQWRWWEWGCSCSWLSTSISLQAPFWYVRELIPIIPVWVNGMWISLSTSAAWTLAWAPKISWWNGGEALSPLSPLSLSLSLLSLSLLSLSFSLSPLSLLSLSSLSPLSLLSLSFSFLLCLSICLSLYSFPHFTTFCISPFPISFLSIC